MLKVLFESFLGSVMFITSTHSCLDLIPLKSTNDLTSQTEKTVPSADRHPRLGVLKAYCVAEKQYGVLLPQKPSTLLITASSKVEKGGQDCKLALMWQLICRPYGSLAE